MFRNLVNRLLQKIAWVAPGGGSLRPWLHRLRGAKIGRNVWIAQFVYIDELHPEDIIIGDNCTIGLRTSIFAHFYWGGKRAKSNGKVIIESDSFVGPHCVILPNTRIGRGTVIKAGTVVSKSVPPGCFFGPLPAGILAEVRVPLTADHSYEEFMAGIRPHRKR